MNKMRQGLAHILKKISKNVGRMIRQQSCLLHDSKAISHTTAGFDPGEYSEADGVNKFYSSTAMLN